MYNTEKLLLFSTICLTGSLCVATASFCDSSNFRNLENYQDDYLLYGITQDCQMFFIRPSQMSLLSNIKIDKRHSFCFPNLVQLHLKSHDSLLLTFKQAANRICTLEVTIPSLSMLFGDHLFRYSLLNSLPYASCSHSTDQSFQLEPDLSFMDPVYRDVIYFIDASSTGSKWKVLQFLLKDSGNLSMMNNLTIKNGAENSDAPANEFHVSIDAQKDKLYKRNKFGSDVEYQCGFEMLFSPSESNQVNNFKVPFNGYRSILNAQSVENDLMIYVETDRMTTPATTRLNFLNTSNPENIFCLTSTIFPFEIGIVRESTLKKLQTEPQPPFGTVVTPKAKSKSLPSPTKLPRLFTKSHLKPTSASSDSKSSTTPSAAQPTSSSTNNFVPNPDATSSTQPKPRDSKHSYSPAKSFFSYETTATTERSFILDSATSSDEKVFSNDIPVDENNEDEDEEEEFNEIIKELKDENDEVGELRTVETTTKSDKPTVANQTDPIGGNSSAVTGSSPKNLEFGTGIVFLTMIYCLILNS